MNVGLFNRIYRRVLMMIAPARITTSNDGGHVRKLQVQLSEDEIVDAAPQLQEYGFASNPLPSCDAVVAFVAGDRSRPVVVGTNDQRYRPTGLQPGDVMIYDWRGNSILLSVDGVKIHTPDTFRVEAKDIQLHATHSYRFDVKGHGQHWYDTYIDTWQIGETSGTAHSISPPEIS